LIFESEITLFLMLKNEIRVDKNKHHTFSKKEGYAKAIKGSNTLWKILSHCHTSIDNCLFYFDYNERLWNHFTAILVQNNYLFNIDLQNNNLQKNNDLYVLKRRHFRTIFNLFFIDFRFYYFHVTHHNRLIINIL
jgi:hypothetical protein